MAKGLGDMAFAGAAGADDEHRGLFLQELASGQVQDEGLVDGRIVAEVEAFQGLFAAETGTTDA